MLTSRHLRGRRLGSVAALVLLAAGCTVSARPPVTGTTHAVTGAFLDDGSCRVLVDGVALFTPADTPRTAHIPAAAVNLAPPGYELDEIACAANEAGAGDALQLPPDRGDERALLVTVYAPQGGAARPGRYTVRGALAGDADTTGIATRAGAAVFGAHLPDVGPGASGIRYLEAREGTVALTRLDSDRVVGTFTLRAAIAVTP